MKDSIVTDRLVIRKARRDDLEAIWNNVWKDRSIAEWMLWVPTETLSDAVDRMERTIRYQSVNNAFFVCLRDTDEPIGFAGVREEGDGVWSETGLCIAVSHQGKGFAKETVRALVDYVFNDLGGTRFMYSCFSTNLRSAAVCRSLGFRYLYSKDEIREHDGFKYVCDYYYLDKSEFERIPSDGYICRRADERDLEDLYNSQADGASPRNRDKWTRWKEETLNNHRRGKSQVYVGLLNGRIISQAAAVFDGSILQHGEPKELIDDETAYLSSFMTEDCYQNHGYFSRLFSYMLDDLKNRGYRKVTLGVEPDNERNMSIYKHLGFVHPLVYTWLIYPDGRQKAVAFFVKDI